MRLKKIFVAALIALILFVGYGIYKLSTFSIFGNEFIVLKTIKIPDKNYSLKIYYIPSNASSNSFIQVRKFENNVEEVIENYERYNSMDNCSLLNDTTLQLVIRDTISVLGNSPDTVLLTIK